MEIIQTKHILMQQVVCLSAVCHITTALLLLTQHRRRASSAFVINAYSPQKLNYKKYVDAKLKLHYAKNLK